MKGRSANAVDKKWMDDITQLGCCVCHRQFNVFTEAEVHHIDGKTKEGAHLNSIPLCLRHHRAGDSCRKGPVDGDSPIMKVERESREKKERDVVKTEAPKVEVKDDAVTEESAPAEAASDTVPSEG